VNGEKLFRATTKVGGFQEPMVDWYEADTLEQARALWAKDCKANGLPPKTTTVAIVECDIDTLKPLVVVPAKMKVKPERAYKPNHNLEPL